MLARLTRDLAAAVSAVDARRPVAVNKRSGIEFEPGLGPHSEAETFSLLLNETRHANPGWITELHYSVPYAAGSRQRCDAHVVTADGELFVEGKLLRLKGDNGKPNDNMLMHILSPYPQHRSALTDCLKLSRSQFGGEKAIVVVGYGYTDIPLEPAIDAFERLAATLVDIGQRHEATFSGLCHRVHQEGRVMAWRVGAAR